MSLLRRFIRITIAFSLFASTALADIPQELQTVVLEGNLYGRSSVNFLKNAKNVTSLVPEGTTGTVLETRKLSRTGSYAVKVRVTQVKKNMGSTTVKKDAEVWVYYSQEDPWLSFKDKKGDSIQDPEEALSVKAKRDGSALPAALPAEGIAANPTLPTKKEIQRIEAQLEKNSSKINVVAEASFSKSCAKCSTDNNHDKNVKALSDIQYKIGKRKPAKLDPNNPWADDPFISAYSNSNSVAEAIRAAKRAAGHSKKLCYRYVKRALLAGDLLDTYPQGSYPRNSVGEFKRQGMVNLLDNPKYSGKIKRAEDAPKGAVLIYRHGRHPGHIEIKTANGKNATYVSDYQSPRSIMSSVHGISQKKLGDPYELIGVMILPPEKL